MKKEVIKVSIAFILFVIALAVPFENVWINTVIYVISYIIVGAEVVIEAIKNILKKEIFDENFLMAIATLGAFGIGEFPEAVAVMLFYQIGEMFQEQAVNKSKKSITNLMNIKPDFANRKIEGKIEKVKPEEIKVGEEILVKPGEKVPLDGIVIEGNSMLDTSSLTGESVPKKVAAGNQILSGVINQTGLLTIKVTKEYKESTVSKMLDLMENASSKKSKSENFIRKFAKYYTPIVVMIALVLAIVPPFIFQNATFTQWLYRALSFLVISCPCALVISIPLSFFGGIGGTSKLGVLIKGGNYIETLANTKIVVFDKTGTLTKGTFAVQSIQEAGYEKNQLLKIAAHAENYSNHPIAISIKKAYQQQIQTDIIQQVQEISGLGIEAIIDNKKVLIGNEKLMEKNNILYEKCDQIGTIVYIAIDTKFAGSLVIADEIKEDSLQTIKDLKKNHIKKTVMLTGDKYEVAKEVAKQLQIDQCYAQLLPEEKVKKVEELISTKSSKEKLAFVGDGVNDSPVLAMADVGIAMGGLGSDAAIEASDIVIMTDEPSKIVAAIKQAKKTMRIVKENILFAISIKIIILLLAAFGLSTMWGAVFADVGVSILAILNALRALKI